MTGRLVLASASPRRRELLGRLGLDPVVRPVDVDERARPGEDARDLVMRLARDKAAACSATDDDVVLAADTVVVVDDDVLGKPADRADATAMLRRLSGRDHEVLTAVVVRRGERVAEAVAATQVTFRALGPDEIAWYVASGEPDDKAGGYAIQGGAGAFVTGIVGSDTSVIGLPLAVAVDLLRTVGWDPYGGATAPGRSPA